MVWWIVLTQSDWKGQLPLLLYIYRTARRTSTHLSPFLLLMERDPVLPIIPSPAGDYRKGHDPHSYVEAQRQKEFSDSTTKSRTFSVGGAVWLHVHVPTAGKLDARWEGGWTVKKVLSPVNVAVEHTTTARTRVVHVNRLQQHFLRGEIEAHGEEHGVVSIVDWETLRIEHFILPPQ